MSVYVLSQVVSTDWRSL